MSWQIGAVADPWGAYDREREERERADASQAYRGMPRLDPGLRREVGDTSELPGATATRETLQDFLIPQTPFDYAMMLAGPAGKIPKAVRAGALALGAMFDPSEAQAGPSAAVRKILSNSRNYTSPSWDMGKPMLNASPVPDVQTVLEPYRMMFPGIYAHPKEIVSEAAQRVVPEDPMLKRLWGVTRDDLEQIARARDPNMKSDVVIPSAKPRGSEAMRNVMTPANEVRLQSILYEAGKHPGLRQTDAWYMQDPMFHRLVQMFGPEEAVARYRHLNTMTGMASPGSDVLTEIQRGTAAHWLERQGRFSDFANYAGLPEVLPKKHKPGAQSRETLGDAFPADMRYIGGHPYHSTSQAGPMEKYLESNSRILRGEAPKVPEYVQASGVPQTGYQTASPVGDAHFSRGIGLADTRKGPTDVGASWSRAEYETGAPWWRERIARPLDLNAVQAQARLWNVLGPQTGVDSPIGAGKLELFSQQIAKAAARLGVTPETARDLILSGKAGAGALAGVGLGMGGLARQDTYNDQLY